VGRRAPHFNQRRVQESTSSRLPFPCPSLSMYFAGRMLLLPSDQNPQPPSSQFSARVIMPGILCWPGSERDVRCVSDEGWCGPCVSRRTAWDSCTGGHAQEMMVTWQLAGVWLPARGTLLSGVMCRGQCALLRPILLPSASEPPRTCWRAAISAQRALLPPSVVVRGDDPPASDPLPQQSVTPQRNTCVHLGSALRRLCPWGPR